jgi:hypothetical protein
MKEVFSCPECGNQVESGTGLCSHCGHSLSWQSLQKATPQDQKPVSNSERTKKKTGPWLLDLLGVLCVLILIGGVIFASIVLSQKKADLFAPIQTPKAALETLLTYEEHRQWDKMWTMLHPDSQALFTDQAEFIKQMDDLSSSTILGLKGFTIRAVEIIPSWTSKSGDDSIFPNKIYTDVAEIQLTNVYSTLLGDRNVLQRMHCVKYANEWRFFYGKSSMPAAWIPPASTPRQSTPATSIPATSTPPASTPLDSSASTIYSMQRDVSLSNQVIWNVIGVIDRGNELSASQKRFYKKGYAFVTSGKFIQVTVQVENVSGETRGGVDNPKIVDSQGIAFDDPEGYDDWIPEGQKWSLVTLEPNIRRQFVIIYDLPLYAKGLKLQVFDFSASPPKTALINLGM